MEDFFEELQNQPSSSTPMKDINKFPLLSLTSKISDKLSGFSSHS